MWTVCPGLAYSKSYIHLLIITTVFLPGRLFQARSTGGRSARSCGPRAPGSSDHPASGLAGGAWPLHYGPRAARVLPVLVWVFAEPHWWGFGTGYHAPGDIRCSDMLSPRGDAQRQHSWESCWLHRTPSKANWLTLDALKCLPAHVTRPLLVCVISQSCKAGLKLWWWWVDSRSHGTLSESSSHQASWTGIQRRESISIK